MPRDQSWERIFFISPAAGHPNPPVTQLIPSEQTASVILMREMLNKERKGWACGNRSFGFRRKRVQIFVSRLLSRCLHPARIGFCEIWAGILLLDICMLLRVIWLRSSWGILTCCFFHSTVFFSTSCAIGIQWKHRRNVKDEIKNSSPKNIFKLCSERMDGSCSMQVSLYMSAPLNLKHKLCRNERAILLPIYGTIYTCAGPAVYQGKVRSRMLRLPVGGLHYTEHVLLILWWRSIIGGFSADARFGGGQITGSPAATCGVGGFALCVFQDVNQKGGEQGFSARNFVVWTEVCLEWMYEVRWVYEDGG